MGFQRISWISCVSVYTALTRRGTHAWRTKHTRRNAHAWHTHVCRTKAGAGEEPYVMGTWQNAFEYTNPRPVNPKKKPPLFQSQIPHINIYEPRSPGIQCWKQPRHRREPTLKCGGRGRNMHCVSVRMTSSYLTFVNSSDLVIMAGAFFSGLPVPCFKCCITKKHVWRHRYTYAYARVLR